ncbi:MAG: hypothetical protein JNL95_01140 [Chitinophagales bacterium]|nr:hypothetical protein [Chitinophagales bacterium]
MKSIVLPFFLIGSMMSCKKACVDCSSSTAAFKGTVCKSEYVAGAGSTAGAPSWSAYREVLMTTGCTDAQ